VLDSAIDLLESNPPAAAELLRNLKVQNQVLVADIRRLVYELRPPALDELGLSDAIGVHIQQLTGHSPTSFLFHVQPGALDSLPAAVEVAVYRLVQEGLNNVLRHAYASKCTVECRQVDGQLTLTNHDDGRGIPVEARGSVGILSMRERVEELGGKLSITPAEPVGTLLTATLPYPGKIDD